MRIGFVGCGAIGSCYASYLLTKHEVCVLDTYAPVIEAIRKDGICWINAPPVMAAERPFQPARLWPQQTPKTSA